MSDQKNPVELNPPGSTSIRLPLEIASVPHVTEAAAWGRRDPSIPNWTYSIFSVIGFALIVLTVIPFAGIAEHVAKSLGLHNAMWIAFILLPTAFVLFIASNRLLRHSTLAGRVLKGSYYIAWASVSSWKPQIQEQGIDALLEIDGRKARAAESLRHLKWVLWTASAFYLLALGVIVYASRLGLILPEQSERASVLSIVLAAASLLTARGVALRNSTIGPTAEELKRAADLQRECLHERERLARQVAVAPYISRAFRQSLDILADTDSDLLKQQPSTTEEKNKLLNIYQRVVDVYKEIVATIRDDFDKLPKGSPAAQTLAAVLVMNEELLKFWQEKLAAINN